MISLRPYFLRKRLRLRKSPDALETARNYIIRCRRGCLRAVEHARDHIFWFCRRAGASWLVLARERLRATCLYSIRGHLRLPSHGPTTKNSGDNYRDPGPFSNHWILSRRFPIVPAQAGHSAKVSSSPRSIGYPIAACSSLSPSPISFWTGLSASITNRMCSSSSTPSS